VTDTAGYPSLTVGQHIIVSAFFGELAKAWLPWGFFEVREGRVVSLQSHLLVKDYDSVEAFAAALANPPPTLTR
jgi:hypothetical protein